MSYLIDRLEEQLAIIQSDVAAAKIRLEEAMQVKEPLMKAIEDLTL